jgi:two-component system CheB/CheR fusion protein
LIYLKQDLQQVVLDLFAYSLHQSYGYLFLGKAETARPTKAAFELVNKKWKIYRCLAGPLAFPTNDGSPQTVHNANELLESRRLPAIAAPKTHVQDLTIAEAELGQLRRINETLLRYLNVAIVIIDRQYRILTINAAARRLLGVRDISSDLDFLHTVRGMPYQEVRHAIDSCFREHTTTLLDAIELDGSSEGSGRHVSLTIVPMQIEPGGPELAALTAMDVTDQVQMKKRFESVQLEHADLVNELSTANKRFTTMNTELQDANEELQAANEELMLTQEELQATNEEFEATNEELQATNEELETNNEELQATNEELQTTNDELTSRTGELQELAKQHRLEQLQLSTLLERYPHYVMVLNAEDLTIQTINPAYEKLLGTRDVVGLPISEVFGGREVDELIRILRRSLRERQPFEVGPILANVDVAEAKGIRFVHTVVPIVDASGSVANRIFIYSERTEDGEGGDL